MCSHCDIAQLAALVRIEGTLLMKGGGRATLEIATDTPQVARFVIKSLHDSFSLKTDLTMRRSVLHKTPNWLIEVPYQPGFTEALTALGVLNDEGLERGIDPTLVHKACCAEAYLRGVFLGSGFISNPRGDFHFELTVESEALAGDVAELMRSRGINAKVMPRRNAYVVYLKSGSGITAFLAAVGAHQSALKIESERVVKSVRNDVNRRVNAEVANQAKSVEAAMAQVNTIRAVLDAHGFEELPQALQEFIILRVRNPNATLKELGEIADPPLSKSAVYHRVRRLEQLAKEAQKGR